MFLNLSAISLFTKKPINVFIYLPMHLTYFQTYKSLRWFTLILGSYYIVLPNQKMSFEPWAYASLIIRLYLLKTLRFSFSGKGYRVYRDSNAFTFSFGHSHLFYIYFFNATFVLLSKTRGFILGLDSFALSCLAYRFFSSKPLNIFTWRGVKLKTNWLPKKAGKVSMYR